MPGPPADHPQFPFRALAAMSENRVIGINNSIPWHLPEDFKWFKKMTLGKTIIMGRKTFDSIGKPLPGRTTWVLSRSTTPIPDVEVFGSLEDILKNLHRAGDSPPIICGGSDIYQQTLPLCSDLYLTIVKQNVDGDSFFPEVNHLFQNSELIKDCNDFRIVHFSKNS